RARGPGGRPCGPYELHLGPQRRAGSGNGPRVHRRTKEGGRTPRRVAYVVNVFPKLSETFIAGELAELRRRGVEVLVLSLRQPEAGLRHEVVYRAGLLERTAYDPGTFEELLRQFGPDLLHAHFATEPAAAARDLATRLGLPFTFTARGFRTLPPAAAGLRRARGGGSGRARLPGKCPAHHPDVRRGGRPPARHPVRHRPGAIPAARVVAGCRSAAHRVRCPPGAGQEP